MSFSERNFCWDIVDVVNVRVERVARADVFATWGECGSGVVDVRKRVFGEMCGGSLGGVRV